MIENCIKKLIINLPNHITDRKKPLKIDLILDGGMFNGSYLIGCLYFLKELERLQYIKIERISGCSIGSVMGFLYFIDALHLAESLYGLFFENFKKEYHLPILTNLYNLLKSYIPDDICQKVKNRFYVTYYNVKKMKKIIKKEYFSAEDITQTLIRSCFVPIVINGNLLYKNKYIDGINPYLFPVGRRKILYLDLYGYDKLFNMICVKNEKTNIHRIMNGLLDIHTFFIKQSSTSICSYMNDWNIFHKLHYNLKLKLEKINLFIIYTILYLKKHFPSEYQYHSLYIMISNILYDFYKNLIGNYCV
jgi:hypothetical protein